MDWAWLKYIVGMVVLLVIVGLMVMFTWKYSRRR